MNELQTQLAELEAQKESLFENDTVDQTEVSQLNEKINAVQAQIAQLNAQQAVIEEKVQADDVPFANAGIDFAKMPAGLVEVINAVVKADRRRTFTAQAELDAKKDTDYAAYKAQVEARIAGLQKDYNDLEQECLEVRNELKDETAAKLQAISERDEARTNRDNAAVQLDEANKEIARLNSQIDDYQKAQVFGEREAQNVIEGEYSAAEASEINTALQKLYTSIENWGSINKVVKPDGTFELVKNGDLEQWAPAQGGSETSQSTFPEAPAADTENSELPSADGEITPPPFQVEVPNVDNTVGGESANAEVAPVTREEFQELAARVAQLEQVNTGAAA